MKNILLPYNLRITTQAYNESIIINPYTYMRHDLIEDLKKNHLRLLRRVSVTYNASIVTFFGSLIEKNNIK